LFCFSSLSIGHQVVASSYPVSLFFLRDELMGISDEPVYKDKILELLARAPITPCQCPQCGSNRLFKDGLRYTHCGTVQRYLCRDCAYRFSQSHKSNNLHETSNASQLCVSLQGAKKLTTATEIKTVAGETNRTIEEAKGKILELCLHLKRQGYSDETIRLNRIALKVLLDRGANLYDEGSVKDVISRQTWSDNRRRNVINAYDIFVKFSKLSWEKPRCVVVEKFPFVPTEQEIDALISAAGKKLSTFLLLLKETAMRRGEAKRLE